MNPTQYEIKERVGKGSFGQVFRAIEKTTNNTVAIKIIDLEDSGDDMDDIRQEIRTLATLKSPWVIEYHASFVKNASLWIVMEYCSEGSCLDRMKKYGTFKEDVTAIIIRETLCGLNYLHSLGKIHRDIKAANILLTNSGNVKLADFGVSGQITATISKKNTFVGTPYWMSPEVILRSAYNTKADVWSLGITAWELIMGLPPNAQIHPMKVLFMIPRDPSPTLPDHLSSTFSDFFYKCLEKKQNQRPNAKDLLEHDFIKKAGSLSDLKEFLLNSTGQPIELKTTDPTLQLKGQLDPEIPPGWDFETCNSINSNQKSLVKKYNDTLKLGKNVVFEDEFEVKLPEEHYQDVAPFGYDLLKSIVIPSFRRQRGNCSNENRSILDSLLEKMNELALKEPLIAENACRAMLEDLFSSTRQSLKEFLETITKNSKLENEMDDFDDFDAQKLSFHSVKQAQKKENPKPQQYRSQVGGYLLERWLKR